MKKRSQNGLTSWSRIVAEDQGGGTLCFPPCTYPSNFQNIGRMMMKLIFLERTMHFRSPDNLSHGYTTKNIFFETLQKKFFIKNSKNCYFLWLQILHGFSIICRNNQKLIFSRWFKSSYIPEFSSKHSCEYLRNIIPSSMPL